MAKAAKIDDVKKQASPAPTSRPILVTDKSEVPGDPMLAPEKDQAEKPKEELAVAHSAKTIQPLNAIPVDKQEETEPAEEASAEEAEAPAEEAEAPAEPAATPPEETSKESHSIISTLEPKRDSEAEITAEEAAAAEAQAAREIELENIISSGKYVVPINAVQRKRSRMNIVLLVLVALALAVALADVVLDAGLVSAPDAIPHTHLFTNK